MTVVVGTSERVALVYEDGPTTLEYLVRVTLRVDEQQPRAEREAEVFTALDRLGRVTLDQMTPTDDAASRWSEVSA